MIAKYESQILFALLSVGYFFSSFFTYMIAL